MDARSVEEGDVDIGHGAVDEMAAADGENLAHSIAAAENAVLVRSYSPHGILFRYLDDDNIIGNTLQQFCKILV